MNANQFYRLDSISVVDVVGNDAEKIVHNLTTNEVTKLGLGIGCESFITDVRGKTLGHVVVFRQQNGLRLMGAGGQSERLVEHVDRYTIREDAQGVVRDQDYVAVVLAKPSAARIGIDWFAKDGLRSAPLRLGDVVANGYQTPWLGAESVVILIDSDQAAAATDWLAGQSLTAADEHAFHQRRTMAGFPWYGIDLDETNLPQEAERNAEAISLTKGCYLGQETVARLDALGQVQKKLVRWSIRGVVPGAGATLTSGEKTVGRLTSVAAGGDQDAVAIGFARRSHFDAGATAEGIDESSKNVFTGRVL